jgi:hypothetical protein
MSNFACFFQFASNETKGRNSKLVFFFNPRPLCIMHSTRGASWDRGSKKKRQEEDNLHLEGANVGNQLYIVGGCCWNLVLLTNIALDSSIYIPGGTFVIRQQHRGLSQLKMKAVQFFSIFFSGSFTTGYLIGIFSYCSLWGQ